MLYAKKEFYQFKKGQSLPVLPANIEAKLIADGYATKTKPRKAKK